MDYMTMFQRYGSACPTSDIKIYSYQTRPDRIADKSEITMNDNRAAQTIKECEVLIAKLQAYRQALAARYGELCTMAQTDVYILQRYIRHDNRKIYYVRHVIHYEDGTQRETETESFPGSERAKAFARFAELKKLHPSATFEQDTDKRPWER